MKKLISIMATMILATILLVMPATAAETVASGTCGLVSQWSDGSGMTWTLDRDGKLVIRVELDGSGIMEMFVLRTDDKSPWAYNEQITSVEIQEGVRSIGMFAFIGCSNLKSVTFPQSLTEISMDAFAGCTSLEHIDIPVSASVKRGAFASCKALTSVALPYSENLDECFSGSDNIRNILYYGNEGSWERANGKKLLEALGEDVQLTFKPRTASGTCSITVGSDLKWTVSEDGELRICGYGPMGRGGDVNTMRMIPFGWEPYRSEVDRIVVEDGVTSIGDFRDLWAVESIYIPTSVTEIAAGCFPDANRKTTVYYAGTEAQWNKIDINKETDKFALQFHGWNSGLDSCTFVYNHPVPVVVRFTDVPDTSYYANSIRWAVERNITQGTGNGTFSPDKVCTRGEILTFLWRASGSPDSAIISPYADIHANKEYKVYYHYYRDAALWAYENGIYTGEARTDFLGRSYVSFAADKPCTRRDAVVYLWKAAGSPKGYSCNFSDISKADAEAVQAVGWAVNKGVTVGTSSTTFSPNKICTRGQIVTFLHRSLN